MIPRLITLADVEVLAKLHVACFKKPWPAEAFQFLLGEGRAFGFLVEVDTHHCLGFILGRIVLDEAEILSLGVMPEYSRQGVGQLLVAKLIDHTQSLGVREIFLEVSDGNQPALNLYNKFGFNTCGRRENYYKEGEFDSPHALIIRKNLML